MISECFYGTESAIQEHISDLINQFRNPKTDNPEREFEALTADLVHAYQLLRVLEKASDHQRGDWVQC
jgi:hypothetical protein